MEDWVRILVSILLGSIVSTPLDVGIIGELGYGVLFCLGILFLSYLFFSRRVDSPEKETDETGTSEA